MKRERLESIPEVNGQYIITVHLPDGREITGQAICSADVVCRGALGLSPGFSELVISDLSYIDSDGDTEPHDSVEEMILYAMNDGSMKSDHWDSGVAFRLD